MKTAKRYWIPAAAGLLGVAMIASGLALAAAFWRTPATVLEHPRTGSGVAQQVAASFATRLEAISPYARTHSAPPRPAQPRRGLWIEAPALGIDLPVAPGDGSDHIPYWEALWYPGTASPGTAGNSYVYAHGLWGMFGGLLFASEGDHVTLRNYSSGRVQTFQVTRVVGRVAYNDTRWLSLTSATPLLTLQTCVGWDVKGDRFIVEAAPTGGSST